MIRSTPSSSSLDAFSPSNGLAEALEGDQSRTTQPGQRALVSPDAGQLLDFYIARERDLKDAERDHARSRAGRDRGWYISQLGRCYREQYMQRLGLPTNDLDAKTLRTFEWGNQIERFLMKVYWRLGIVAAEQLTVFDEALSGRIDYLGVFPPRPVQETPDDLIASWSTEWVAFLERTRSALAEQQRFRGVWGSDIKSASSARMRWLYKEGSPSERDAIQVGGYMLMAELHAEQLPAVPTRWQIEYVGKDSTGVLAFPVRDEFADIARERYSQLECIWTCRPDPCEVPCECRGWQVRYCPYANPDLGTCCGNP